MYVAYCIVFQEQHNVSENKSVYILRWKVGSTYLGLSGGEDTIKTDVRETVNTNVSQM